MKVLIITNLNKSNSATLPDRKLIKGLHSKGADITVLSQYPGSESPDIEFDGIKFLFQPIIKKIDVAAIRRIRSLIKEEKYDILHLMYGKAITNGLIASRGSDIKIIGYLGSLRVHWHDPFAYLSFLNPRLDKLICVSDGVKEHVLKQLPGRMKSKITRIYRGSDPEWFKGVVPARRNELGIPEDAFVVCCIANVRKIKGVNFLIDAADFLPENLPVWFLLVGDQSDTPSIKKKISKTKYHNNFITIGFSDEPNAYSLICDLYIQPSVSEGLPKTVAEAMCLCKPVIVTEKGGAKELVEEGSNGYIIPAESPVAIAKTIAKCYENRDNLPAMGKKGRERIINYFSHQTTVDRTYDLYLDLLGKND
jgi:glycosyltransferase involved in cell wall biosynthesis